MTIKTFYFNPFRECTYILSNEQNEAIIIDAGCQTDKEKQRVKEYIDKNSLQPIAHLLTHAHLDHCFGAAFIHKEYSIFPTLSAEDSHLYESLLQQSYAFGIELTDTPIQEHHLLPENNILKIGSFPQISILKTPGHTEGSVCYYIKEENILFSGDTLFQGGIGRTDLPGGNYGQIIHSLKELTKLPDNTQILPGHGYATSIIEEKEMNPYL